MYLCDMDSMHSISMLYIDGYICMYVHVAYSSKETGTT